MNLKKANLCVVKVINCLYLNKVMCVDSFERFRHATQDSGK